MILKLSFNILVLLKVVKRFPETNEINRGIVVTYFRVTIVFRDSNTQVPQQDLLVFSSLHWLPRPTKQDGPMEEVFVHLLLS